MEFYYSGGAVLRASLCSCSSDAFEAVGLACSELVGSSYPYSCWVEHGFRNSSVVCFLRRKVGEEEQAGLEGWDWHVGLGMVEGRGLFRVLLWTSLDGAVSLCLMGNTRCGVLPGKIGCVCTGCFVLGFGEHVCRLGSNNNKDVRCGNRKRAARSKRPNTPSDGASEWRQTHFQHRDRALVHQVRPDTKAGPRP